jgi:uncharacterized protein (TIGR02246 family)
MRFITAKILLAAAALVAVGGAQALAQQATDEESIRRAVAQMQDGWNAKSGEAYARPFAEEHDYVVVNGMYFPKMSRAENARAHQAILDRQYKEVDLNLTLDKTRFLTPDICVAHVRGHSYTKGKTDERRFEIVISLVLQKKASRWEIIAFQNTPVQPPDQRPSGR